MYTYTTQQEPLGAPEILRAVSETLAREDLRNRKVLAILPDMTRTAPVPDFFRAMYAAVKSGGGSLDCLIALGTHPPLDSDRISKLVGMDRGELAANYADCQFFNHRWDDPSALRTIGVLAADQISSATGGLMQEDVRIEINKLVFDYDLLMILGPVVPHEVVGFSGGNKYFFPGIGGPEFIDFFHWLGAVMTIPNIIGIADTPVRRVLNLAAGFFKLPRIFFNLVMDEHGLQGIFAGTDEEAWRAAAALSEKLHIFYQPRRYRSVLGIAPTKYDDLWTAAKVAYKLDAIVEDGGELIIYAPHITEISYTHGRLIDQAGYHVRDYFSTRMDAFKHVPGRIKAHSTHVKGTGVYADGREEPRINVVLATGIPEERCRLVNLGYRDPLCINPTDWGNKEDQGLLLVREAGERLYRLRPACGT
jgi:nickel-dependent lactate racemase